MEILVELSDIERFARADELASYIGLTPSEFSTKEYVRQGRITRCGNKRGKDVSGGVELALNPEGSLDALQV